ncbi:MAG: HNH endonuclease [Rhodocyclales bacterium]|nr:HNH endonuclease [Rhodocyclales bacterium]
MEDAVRVVHIRDIRWEDLPGIEDPVIARADVASGFYTEYGYGAIDNIHEVLRGLQPGSYTQPRNHHTLEQLLDSVAKGDVVLTHRSRPPFRPVLRWQKTPHMPTPPDAGTGDARHPNPSQRTTTAKGIEPGRWIVDPSTPSPLRWRIDDWLERGRRDSTLNRGKPEISWWDWIMDRAWAAYGAGVVDGRETRSGGGESSLVERVLPEGAPIVTIGKALGGVAAATAGWLGNDEGLYNAAVDGLRETQSENFDTVVLLGTLGRGGPRNSHLAGSVHPRTGIPFDKAGYPDFSGVAKATVTINQTGTRAGDFAAANKAAGIGRTPEGYTWHHHQDGKTMQLVPRDIHALTGHTGGFGSNP